MTKKSCKSPDRSPVTPECSRLSPIWRCTVPSRPTCLTGSKKRSRNRGRAARTARESYMLNSTTMSHMESIALLSWPSPPQKVSQNHFLSQCEGSVSPRQTFCQAFSMDAFWASLTRHAIGCGTGTRTIISYTYFRTGHFIDACRERTMRGTPISWQRRYKNSEAATSNVLFCASEASHKGNPALPLSGRDGRPSDKAAGQGPVIASSNFGEGHEMTTDEGVAGHSHASAEG